MEKRIKIRENNRTTLKDIEKGAYIVENQEGTKKLVLKDKYENSLSFLNEYGDVVIVYNPGIDKLNEYRIIKEVEEIR